MYQSAIRLLMTERLEHQIRHYLNFGGGKDMDILKEMCIKQGYVPPTCTMEGSLQFYKHPTEHKEFTNFGGKGKYEQI